MAAFGIFFNQGETCSANSRLYVQREIKDAFVAKMVALAKVSQPGDPLDPASKMGAIVDGKQTERIMGFIEAGKTTADLVVGGKQVTVDGQGHYVEPTIFYEVDHDDPIAR